MCARRGSRTVRWATCVRMAVACAHARPIVARLWKKYAAVRKVKELSAGASIVERHIQVGIAQLWCLSFLLIR